MRNEIECHIHGRESNIGIPVKRILPWSKKRMVGPFIFLDHMGPAILHAPTDRLDVRPHPHIGLSTLTYLFEGEILHRDSLGYQQLILPGEVNWMTAGRGISHSERETQEARVKDRMIHGLQFWVALPKELEDMAPDFHHYEKEDIPEITTDALTIRVVAGEFQGQKSKLKAHSPMTFMVMRAKKKGLFQFHREDHESALYVVKGSISADGETVSESEMLVFKKGSEIHIEHSEDALFALIGGEIFPEPRYIWWNLVSSDVKKIERAKADWSEGKFPMVPGDEEKIPAPDLPMPVVNYP